MQNNFKASSIFSLFLKYFFWVLKIGLNFILFWVVDIPLAIFTVARWTHYTIFFFEVFFSLMGQLGYWLARYLTVEDWIYDGYNAPEFENHYYQWRFFLVVRRYSLFAIGIFVKIILGWCISIIHFCYWSIFQIYVKRKRLLKKLYYNLEFRYWKIIYAFGVRLNLSINNTCRFSAFSTDFYCFDRKGWYVYGRDYIDLEGMKMAEMYIPKKFRIKKQDDGMSEEQKFSFRKFLLNMQRQRHSQFPKEDLRVVLKNVDKVVAKDSVKYAYDFHENLIKVVEREYWEQQESLYRQNKLKNEDGSVKKLSESERALLFLNIEQAKRDGRKKLILGLEGQFQDKTVNGINKEGNANKVLNEYDKSNSIKVV